MNANDIGRAAGLSPDETHAAADFLVGRLFAQWETMGGGISITPIGVDEAEHALDAERVQAVSGRIPAAVIGEIAQAFEAEYTHAQFDTLFLRAGAPGSPPVGSKLTKITLARSP